MNPVDPTSSAARIAAQVNTAEPELDRRLLRSGAEQRRNDLTTALRALGLQMHVDASAVARILNLAPSGDVNEVAAAIAEQHPQWFVPRAQPSASRLVEQLLSGSTAHMQGGVH